MGGWPIEATARVKPKRSRDRCVPLEPNVVLRCLSSLALLHGMCSGIECGGDALNGRLLEWLSTHTQAEREF